ncbi:MTH865 family protein [Actinopolymorpha singaporensis]|uniref:MTH865-like family protein n=1 Tax=Actinopolymorpha singaporensis TaxID=117157 RepID=A0A1H1UQ46_9ACTN|nr:MTH865 family protein [Actinopolymorpha singaporensis]SDS74371.1 MTH865-like family protein [Actinopolymorpha singaporensis]
MAPAPQGYQEVQRYADQVSERTDYPIRNVRDLVGALGDEDTEVQHRGRRIKLGQLRRMLPESFFPVESREDLIAKLGHLEVRSQQGAGGHEAGEQRDRPADDAGDPPSAEHVGRPGGFPGLRGHGKRQ